MTDGRRTMLLSPPPAPDLSSYISGSNIPFPPEDSSVDSSETVYLSSLALLKILKHARSGIPLEVMGIMLGVFVDDYTIEIKDVFSMPQTGCTVSVESFDELYQSEMYDLLRQTGLDPKITVVGWYHSHPGYGCWLSRIDLDTHMGMQRIHGRCIALVVDPVQTVKGKVVMDVFRIGDCTRNVTGNIGSAAEEEESVDTKKQMARGLNKTYYKLNYKFRMSNPEREMLMKTKSIATLNPLRLPGSKAQDGSNLEILKSILINTDDHLKGLGESDKKIEKDTFGTIDRLEHLESLSQSLLQRNILQNIRMSANYSTFQANGDKTNK